MKNRGTLNPHSEDRLLAIPPHITVKNMGGGVFVHAIDGTGTINTPSA